MKQKRKIHAMVVIGTRPEALKLAPVIREFEHNKDAFKLTVCATAQHRELLDQVVALYRIPVHHDLDLMHPNQSLQDLAARALVSLSDVLAARNPDVVIVQGDTTTAFIASLAAFYKKIKVAHVEAGLRTDDRYAPFPEEINRRLTTSLADFHYAPTAWAKENLLREGVSAKAVEVTGNTIVDAFLEASKLVQRRPPEVPELEDIAQMGRKLIVVTAHRRENFGRGIEDICVALRTLIQEHSDIEIVYPVHPNPNITEPVQKHLGKLPRVHLIPPLGYLQFVWLMTRAFLVLTDSGGVQEEVPSLGVPVLVMRDTTERPEGVQAGVAILVGTDPKRIRTEVNRLLRNTEERLKYGRLKNPYGDGRASQRIVKSLKKKLAL